MLPRAPFGRRALAVVSLIVWLTTVASTADTIVFGPQTFQRGDGQPVKATRTFAVPDPSGPFELRVANQGVASAVISLNGATVLGPSDFNANVTSLVRSVQLRAGPNQLAVELRSSPRSSLTLQIVRPDTGDTTPPTINATLSPVPNANGWSNGPVTVTFDCADAGSGIATCPAPVVVSGEGANQVISGTASDQAGNTATASVTLNIDKTAPVVTATAAPAANANGWRSSTSNREGGGRTIEVKQGERIEIRMPRRFESAYQLVSGGQRRGLLVGSIWDAGSRTFSWQPAPGFLGRLRIVFSNGSERISVRVVVVP